MGISCHSLLMTYLWCSKSVRGAGDAISAACDAAEALRLASRVFQGRRALAPFAAEEQQLGLWQPCACYLCCLMQHGIAQELLGVPSEALAAFKEGAALVSSSRRHTHLPAVHQRDYPQCIRETNRCNACCTWPVRLQKYQVHSSSLNNCAGSRAGRTCAAGSLPCKYGSHAASAGLRQRRHTPRGAGSDSACVSGALRQPSSCCCARQPAQLAGHSAQRSWRPASSLGKPAAGTGSSRSIYCCCSCRLRQHAQQLGSLPAGADAAGSVSLSARQLQYCISLGPCLPGL